MAGCDHMRDECKVKFEALEKWQSNADKRFSEGDSKFFDMNSKLAAIFVMLEILPKLDEKIEKVIDSNGFTLKQLIGYGITFLFGLASAVIVMLLKGGATP